MRLTSKPPFHARLLCQHFLKQLVLPALAMLPLLGSGQGFLHTQGGKIVNEKGENVLLRGIGLGGWMLQEGYMLRVQGIGQQQHSIKSHMEELVGKSKTAAFYDAWLSNHTTRKDIEALRRWGFNSVRLPMHYNLYTLPVENEPVKGKQTWLQRGFDLTDSLLAWCRDNEIYLILDLHAAPGGQGHDLNISDGDDKKPFLWDSQENKEKTIALWAKLAERYQDEPWIGAYDILNEPNWGFTDKDDRNGLKEQDNGPLRELMMDISHAIREKDQKHIIIIEGNGWGNNYNGILPAWDNNMVLSFHKYWNYNDQASIQRFIDFREKYQMPIWLGESGENSNVWFTQAISLMEQNNIGWCWWPLKKLGSNNPLEISTNNDYNQVLDYWAGKGPRPTADKAFQGLMQLAKATNIQQNIVHEDVLDAMFRQIKSNETLAFKEHKIKAGFVLPATAYDLGKNGTAYFDTDTADYHVSTGKSTPGNRGRAYRNDGVDIKMNGNESHITHIDNNEWLQYSINVADPAAYSLQFVVSTTDDTGEIKITLPQTGESKNVVIPITGGAETWKSIASPAIHLQKGKQVLRISFLKGGFNLKEIRFEKAV